MDRGFEEFRLDAVILDNRGAALLAMRHLLGFGHERIAMIGGPLTLSTGAQRLAGYRESLLEAGVRYDPRWVRDAAFREQPAYEAACELLALPERPTAMFAANNLIAIGVMRAITDAGLRCPEDVSIVSIDDFAWANAFRPRLTTVAQPVEAMGDTAMRLLLGRLNGSATGAARTEVMEPVLVERDSCCAPARGAGRPWFGGYGIDWTSTFERGNLSRQLWVPPWSAPAWDSNVWQNHAALLHLFGELCGLR